MSIMKRKNCLLTLIFPITLIVLIILFSHTSFSDKPKNSELFELQEAIRNNPKIIGIKDLPAFIQEMRHRGIDLSGKNINSVKVPLIIYFTKKANPALIKRLLRLGVKITSLSPSKRVAVVRASLTTLQVLEKMPGIKIVELPRAYRISNIQSVSLIRADEVWNVRVGNANITGKGVTVCVIDTGIDYTYPEFGNCSTVYKPANKSVRVINYFLNITSPTAENITISIPNFTVYSVHLLRYAVYPGDYLRFYNNNGVLIKTIANGSADYDVWTNPTTAHNVTVEINFTNPNSFLIIDMVANGTMVPENLSVCKKFVGGYDFVNNDSIPKDDVYHGTAVAAIIGANSSTFKGVAPGVRFAILKACDKHGLCYDDTVLSSIYWCINNSKKYNISIISMSLGDNTTYNTSCDDYEPIFSDAIHSAIKKNITVVIASGNGYDRYGISSPACISGVIPVGATTNNDTIANFSNRGPTFDYFVLAPGVNIYVPELLGRYGYVNGTSFSAPHVSGVVALMQQFYKTIYGRLPLPSLIAEKLVSTGVKIFDNATGAEYPRVDAYAAVLSLDPTPPEISIISPQTSGLIINKTSLNVTASIVDNFALKNASVLLKYDGAQKWNAVFNKTYAGNVRNDTITADVNFPQDGFYTLKFEACDYTSCNNSTTIFVVVDTTPPSLSINLTNGTTYKNSSLPVYVRCTDLTPITDMKICINQSCINATCANGGARILLQNLTDGWHSIYVRARDTAGNDGTSPTYFIKVMENPKLELKLPKKNGTILNRSWMNFSVEIRDNSNLSAVWVEINSTIQNITFIQNLTRTNILYNVSLAEGENNLTICVNDTYGLTTCSAVLIGVDTTPPIIVVNGFDRENITTSGTLKLNVSVEDTPFNNFSCGLKLQKNYNTLWYPVVNESIRPFLSNNDKTFTNLSIIKTLPDGMYKLDINCTDEAGLKTTFSRIFYVDTRPPSFRFLTNPTTNTIGNTIYTNVSILNITFTFGDAGTGIKSLIIENMSANATTTLLNLTNADFRNITQKNITTSIIFNRNSSEQTFKIKVEDFANHTIERNLTLFYDNTPPQITEFYVPKKVYRGTKLKTIAICKVRDNNGIYKLEISGDTSSVGKKVAYCCAYDPSLNVRCVNRTFYVYVSSFSPSPKPAFLKSAPTAIRNITKSVQGNNTMKIIENGVMLVELYVSKTGKTIVDITPEERMRAKIPLSKMILRTSRESRINVNIRRVNPHTLPKDIGNKYEPIRAFEINVSNTSAVNYIQLDIVVDVNTAATYSYNLVALVVEEDGSYSLHPLKFVGIEGRDAHFLLRLEHFLTVYILGKRLVETARQESNSSYSSEWKTVGKQRGENQTYHHEKGANKHRRSELIIGLFALVLVAFCTLILTIIYRKRHKEEKQDYTLSPQLMKKLELLQLRARELEGRAVSQEERERLRELLAEIETLRKRVT